MTHAVGKKPSVFHTFHLGTLGTWCLVCLGTRRLGRELLWQWAYLEGHGRFSSCSWGLPWLPKSSQVVLCLQNTYWLKYAMHIFLVCWWFFFRGLGELTWGSRRRLLAPDANWLFQPQIIHFLLGTQKNLTEAQIIHVRHPFFVKGNLWQLCDLHLASEERTSAERLQCLQWAGIWNIITTRLPGHGTQVHFPKNLLTGAAWG